MTPSSDHQIAAAYYKREAKRLREEAMENIKKAYEYDGLADEYTAEHVIKSKQKGKK